MVDCPATCPPRPAWPGERSRLPHLGLAPGPGGGMKPMLARPWLLATPPAPVSWGPMAMTVVLSHLTQAHCHLALTLLQTPSPKLSNAESQLVPPNSHSEAQCLGPPTEPVQACGLAQGSREQQGEQGVGAVHTPSCPAGSFWRLSHGCLDRTTPAPQRQGWRDWGGPRGRPNHVTLRQWALQVQGRGLTKARCDQHTSCHQLGRLQWARDG